MGLGVGSRNIKLKELQMHRYISFSKERPRHEKFAALQEDQSGAGRDQRA